MSIVNTGFSWVPTNRLKNTYDFCEWRVKTRPEKIELEPEFDSRFRESKVL
ncbi:hypothetical protein LEP1GSC132_3446 [Leptospira kirschneri str. 200803703]|uniref:Uncharacterized protein n=2 Tax=Leptospira kirschneri TaxID=29507 RepID=A0A828Y179_9LEPT|nr:hypothetical protein LEP1GSC044_1605 [Leptospira kirschneri serovar Grippotyphosa str. RM52]EKO50646.1 hypothetical protein LEP1GSC131_0809 [Leptospira kirschneri str. 200802841]EKO58898.1 hypothetical protein LEP1GSC082_2147 [Leptospira kirschneri str. H2]EKQ83967.1 hypothetical protein LEP1GSC064_3725 [Leptospira kirschneri serovar Grippotyphosa str. Moskva]EKR10495.1 hypothetical protein LEP1GSC122_3901 [Leptospira kirschneri serovar Valbuzzi str. 200702274]EMK06424.1 hypothetical protei